MYFFSVFPIEVFIGFILLVDNKNPMSLTGGRHQDVPS